MSKTIVPSDIKHVIYIYIYMVTVIWINICLGNGLLRDGTKSWPEPMLTYHQCALVAFTWRRIHSKCSSNTSLRRVCKLLIIPPTSTKLKGGYTGITLSVRPSVRPSVDKIVSALYLQQYSSDPFHICTSYQATKEGVSRVMPVSKFKNLKFWRIC